MCGWLKDYTSLPLVFLSLSLSQVDILMLFFNFFRFHVCWATCTLQKSCTHRHSVATYKNGVLTAKKWVQHLTICKTEARSVLLKFATCFFSFSCYLLNDSNWVRFKNIYFFDIVVMETHVTNVFFDSLSHVVQNSQRGSKKGHFWYRGKPYL